MLSPVTVNADEAGIRASALSLLSDPVEGTGTGHGVSQAEGPSTAPAAKSQMLSSSLTIGQCREHFRGMGEA